MGQVNNIFKNSVYRYRSCTDCAVDAFKKDRLYFSTPKYFNDPFDAVIHVNENKLLASILRDLDEGMVSYLDAKVNDPTSFVDEYVAAVVHPWPGALYTLVAGN